MAKPDAGRMQALDPDVLARSIDAVGRAITITDTEPKIIAVNKRFTEITGYEARDVVGKNPNVLQSGQQSHGFYKHMWSSLSEQGFWEGEIWNRRKTGQVYPEWLNITAVRDDDGETQCYVSVFSDITQRKFTETQLQERAYFDPLTGLVNREMLKDRLEQAIGLAKRASEPGVAMLIDLDGFKLVNDVYGHEAGDRVLMAVAARIVGSMRDNDTVARLGGDEFTVLCPKISGRSGCEIIARRLMRVIRERIQLASGEFVTVDASIGMAQFPDDAAEPKGILKAADEAMYAVKAAGKSGFAFASDMGSQFGAEAEEPALRNE